ncbi:FkbM family methyltransferase [Massilia sp. YMA4]|uniref:FkbM family methyltransferase n=1 Tax=Massilia sp. YMA4 TaxID=1593482 RepID=UPI000DD1388A|nr:FkbM family methyltransferase [Massilia sp. YMA4]AXA94087.1 hypothetical protein DPH57_24895 [Massilia sp. YMA4]
MSFTSYAANLEDVLLWRVLRHVDNGFYVDVGAGDPSIGSVTRAFYDRGWRGINVEPGHARQAALRRARPADVNLQMAAGVTAGDALFYEAEQGQSGFDAGRAERLAAQGIRVKVRQTPVATLAQLCAQHAAGPIHLVRISTGGNEEEIAATLDWQLWRPLVVVLRHHGRAPSAVLHAAGYVLAFDDGVNHFHVAAEQPHLAGLLATPANTADGFVLCEDHPLAHPLAALRDAAASARQEAAAATTRLQETMAWVEARRREHDEAVATAQRLGRDAAELDMLRHSLQATEQRVRDAEAILHATYASLSWRLTRPLRSANFRARNLLQRARRLAGQARHGAMPLAMAPLRVAKRLLRATAARTLKAAVAFVVARPKLAFRLRSTVARFPRLLTLVKTVAMRGRTQPVAPVTVSTVDTSSMPAPARQAFDHLRRAVRGPRNL